MKSPCKYPGCRALLDKSGYCETHAHAAKQPQKDYERKRANDPALSMAASIRDTARWRAVKRLKLSLHPLCQDPHGNHARRNHTETATQVHHIKPLVTHPELAYDLDNLLSVCTRCHATLSQMERRQAE